jgi:hypothetical protein
LSPPPSSPPTCVFATGIVDTIIVATSVIFATIVVFATIDVTTTVAITIIVVTTIVAITTVVFATTVAITTVVVVATIVVNSFVHFFCICPPVTEMDRRAKSQKGRKEDRITRAKTQEARLDCRASRMNGMSKEGCKGKKDVQEGCEGRL